MNFSYLTLPNKLYWRLFIWHDDVIQLEHFPRHWPFVWGIHRSPVNSPHKGQWRGALMFSLICVWINAWVNDREAGELRRYHAHYDVTVMGKIHVDMSATNQQAGVWTDHSPVTGYVPLGLPHKCHTYQFNYCGWYCHLISCLNLRSKKMGFTTAIHFANAFHESFFLFWVWCFGKRNILQLQIPNSTLVSKQSEWHLILIGNMCSLPILHTQVKHEIWYKMKVEEKDLGPISRTTIPSQFKIYGKSLLV